MKHFKILVITCLLFATQLSAQRNGHGHRKHKRTKVVVVKRSPYRPAKVVVYHPHWRPAYAYHRRWVYFPRYNFYWDNWRNHYLFWNGSIWLSQPTAPAIVVNVNLDKEKSVELPETEEDEDDVYKLNDAHKNTYKAE